jgi:3D (Asp-Asp-Asp) domain-containing protein
MTLKLKLITCFIGFAYGLSAQTAQTDFNFSSPKEQSKLTSLTLWSTQYYIHEFQSGGSIPIVYADGTPSALFADTCDFCSASLEGTAYIKDSTGKITIINFAKSSDSSFVDCRTCSKYANSKLNVESWGRTVWQTSEGYGNGVKNFMLVPYRTIAVDKALIPYGTVIFIPKARGKTIYLPNGKQVVHDGYFFAADTGGAIKNNHIDLFTGIYKGNPFPEVIQSNENKTFEAFIVTDPLIIEALKVQHIKH